MLVDAEAKKKHSEQKYGQLKKNHQEMTQKNHQLQL